MLSLPFNTLPKTLKELEMKILNYHYFQTLCTDPEEFKHQHNNTTSMQIRTKRETNQKGKEKRDLSWSFKLRSTNKQNLCEKLHDIQLDT